MIKKFYIHYAVILTVMLLASPVVAQTRTWTLAVEDNLTPILSPSAIAGRVETRPGKHEIREIICQKGPIPWAPPGVERGPAPIVWIVKTGLPRLDADGEPQGAGPGEVIISIDDATGQIRGWADRSAERRSRKMNEVILKGKEP